MSSITEVRTNQLQGTRSLWQGSPILSARLRELHVTKKQEIAWIGDRLGDVLMIRSVGIDEE
jgi:3-deoxy-D-manno-octulosonate 8-phosphate phosphatase KdsC-like HAD superfamily phosphatase